MINKTYDNFKNWLLEKTKKSPFYTNAYNYILNTYNSENTKKFCIEDIEKEILKDYAQVEDTYYIDEQSLKRNIQICVNQAINDLCTGQRIKYLGIEEGRKCYQFNSIQKEINSNNEEVQK